MENSRYTFLSVVAAIAIAIVQKPPAVEAFAVVPVPSSPTATTTRQQHQSFSFLEATSTSTSTPTTTTTEEDNNDVPVAAVVVETATPTSTTTSTTTTEEENNPRLSGLAFALDDGTRKSHSMAQNTAFVQGFFKGISSTDSYRNLLTSLYYVYKAMEEDVLDTITIQQEVSSVSSAGEDDTNNNTNNSLLLQLCKQLDDAPLRRLAGLEQDMEYFYGPEWKTKMSKPTKATELYVSRILEIAGSGAGAGGEAGADDSSYLFIAHQYTRYLGDLFGGQMMGGMASRSMDLPDDGSGVAFYTFDGVPSTKNFITDWYNRLNALDLTERQKQAIVDEANLVFDLNVGILEELEGSSWAAMWTLAKSGFQNYWSNIKLSKNNEMK